MTSSIGAIFNLLLNNVKNLVFASSTPLLLHVIFVISDKTTTGNNGTRKDLYSF